MTDYRQAQLAPADRAMLDFAVKLTHTPADMTEADTAELRFQGFDDRAIHEIVQIAALFNYYDRLADGLGIELEPNFDK
jgi:uncharacterized peroxidase-related enzyme